MGNNKVGAVMVVGAGISGIQASLDLAESGYYVYLVEQSTAIGGTMPRLDKTFPTNDCSMCVLSPKLVECGRHLNVEKHMSTDIVEVQGEPGNFKVKLRQRARYIDMDKCTGCGECASVCPVTLPSEFDADLGDRKAIYKMYAQAMPAAFAVDKKGVSPCKAACPTGVNAQGYVQLIKDGKFVESWQLIYEDNPLPAICGRVCTHPCEAACHRKDVDKAVAIRELKRVAADVAYDDLDALPLPEVAPSNGIEVAVIGSGPAGIAAAYQLTKAGYSVTILEALPVTGGMLRVGIPEYRLTNEIIDLEIGLLEKLGVKIKTNTALGPDLTVQDLMEQGYKAVFLAIGAHNSLSLKIPGEDLGGVFPGVDFLRKVSLGEKIELGKKVAVIGGGNTAMDAARTALRLGAEEVTIVYRRSEAEITAAPEEITEAKEENIIFKMMTSPVAMHGSDGKINRLECIENELGEPDESGRRRPVPIAGSEFSIDVDNIIVAIGQAPDITALGSDIDCTKWNTIVVDEDTMATNVAGVFAAGDAVTGPATVVDALGAGKKAAYHIDLYLRGEEASISLDAVPEKIAEFPKHAPAVMVDTQRTLGVHTDPQSRIKDFNEVSLGISKEEAREEAERCLNCAVCSECGECVKACMPKAIDHHMQDEELEIEVGSIILNPGAEIYDPTDLFYYGYKKFPNVVTSIEFERILSASGPFQGNLVRPYDEKEPFKIAWIQCVGSRNVKIGHNYCSSVCCMYAIKEAVIAKEHSTGDLDTTIFMMDMRSYGKDFEKYYERAKNEQGVKFVRSRIFEVTEKEDDSKNLLIRYANENGDICLEEFDLVVLSVGYQASEGTKDLARVMGIELNRYGFAESASLTGVGTTRPGIFAAGTFAGPRDIPETVMQASAAAADSATNLASVRGTLAKVKEYPQEKDVAGEIVRIGVFVCHCGINIGGVVNVPEVVEYVKTLPGVAYATEKLYACSQDTAGQIKEAIEEHELNRVVVCSCSPSTHEPMFQETIREVGLNPNLFEMANIRDQCSWVHREEPEKATIKAKDLALLAVTKAGLLEPIPPVTLELNHDVLVIGGGVSGMTSAINFSQQGYNVHLVEKEDILGGLAHRIRFGNQGEDISAYLAELINKVENDAKIKIHTGTKITAVSGFVGNYVTKLSNGEEILHGVAIVATGAHEYKTNEYLYGQDQRVKTLLELESLLASNDNNVTQGKNFVFIQCVGSRDEQRPYCSRICCAKSIKQALKIKEINPDANIFILYRDIRTYGFQEDLYEEARNKGVIFIRYGVDNKPVLQSGQDKVNVTVIDHVLGAPIEINADLVGLAMAVVPDVESNAQLSQFFKIPLNQEGFFLEAHMKLRPVDFSTDGVFMCGLAHGPKNLDENIAQAKAAVGRACTVLSKNSVAIEGKIAFVNKRKCVGCGECEAVCPAKAVQVDPEENVAVVNEALCKGCGACASSCRSGAINVKGWTNEQLLAMITAL